MADEDQGQDSPPSGLDSLFNETGRIAATLPERPRVDTDHVPDSPGLSSLFRETADVHQQAAGGVPDQYAGQMMRARNQAQGMDERMLTRVLRDIPAFGTGMEIGHNIQLGAAQQRVAARNATDEDFTTIAQHERLAQIKAGEGTGQQVVRSLQGVGRLAGESLWGGAAVAPATAAIGGGLRSAAVSGARGVALRAAETGARSLAGNALGLAATPSMWAPAWTERNLEWNQEHPDQPRSALDPRGAPAAITMGLMQNAILGSMGRYGNAITGTGVRATAARLLTRAGTGMLEQEGADILASGISEVLPRAYRLSTGYGTLGNLMNNPDSPEALRRAVTQSVTFLAFAGIHEAQHGAPTVHDMERHVQQTLDQAHREGLSPEEAAQRLREAVPVPEPAAPPTARAEAPEGTPTWFHTGTEFRPTEGGHQFHLGGEEYHISAQDHPTQGDATAINIRDRSGRVVDSMNFVNNPDGTHSGEIPPNANRKPGMAEALYNYAHDQGATVVPSKGRTNEGRQFWARNQAIRAGTERGLTIEQARESARLKRTGLREAAADEEARARIPGYASAEAPNGQRTDQPAGTLPDGEGPRPGPDTRTPEGAAGPAGPSAEPPAGPRGLDALSKDELKGLAKSLGVSQQGLRDMAARMPPEAVQGLVDRVQGREPAKPADVPRGTPETAPETAPARPESTISPPSDPMDVLRSRFEGGEHFLEILPDVLSAKGVDPAGQHVIMERLKGRSYSEIADDPQIGANNRQNVNHLYNKAIEKLDLPRKVVSAILEEAKGARALRKIEQGRTVSADEMKTAKDAKQRSKDRVAKLEDAANDAVDELVKELENGRRSGIPAERIAEVEQLARQSLESTFLPEEGQGVSRGPADAPQREAVEPEAVRPAELDSRNAGPATAAEGTSRGGQDQTAAPTAPGGGSPAAGNVVRPAGWDGWTAMQKAQWSRAGNPWLKESLRLKFNGNWTVHEAVRDAGGIDPRSFRDPDEVEHWKGLFGDTVFKNPKGKRGTKPVDEMLDELFTASRRAANEGAGTLLRNPEGVDAQDHLFELLRTHAMIDGDHAERFQAEELAHFREITGGELQREHPTWTPEEVERELSEIVSRGEKAGRGEAGNVSATDSIRAAEREPGIEEGEEAWPGRTVRPDTGLSGDDFPFGHAQPGAGFGSPLTQAEARTGGLGGGQPNAGEQPSAEQRTRGGRIALANEITDKQREADGKSPILRQARQANPEVWDRAMRMVEADDKAPQRLVDSLVKNSRPTSVEENALLLHERIALSNEHSRAIREALAADAAERAAKRAGRNPATEKAAADAAFLREQTLSERINMLDKVIVDTGSEWGRAGQFRKQLVAEDYSLSGMLQKAQAAAKRPLEKHEREQIEALSNKIKDLQDKLDTAEEALKKSGAGSKSPDFPAWEEAMVKAKDARQEFDRRITGHRWETMSTGQKAMDWLRRARIAEVISSPITAAKIATSSAEQLAFHPGREAIGTFLRMIPGLRQIAEAAPVEGRGFNPGTEAAALRAGVTQGVKDAVATIRTGRSALDVAYGGPENAQPRTWFDWIGSLHAAEKAPAVRGAFERARQNIEAHEQTAGRDVTTPAALEAIGARAYKVAAAEKFQQDNALVQWVNDAINKAKQPQQPLGLRVAGHAADLLLPVRRTPTNIVADALEHIAGLPVGATKAGIAWAKGVENLQPQQADSIMRMMKKGTVGIGLLALGYYLAKNAGGFYSGRRPEDDLKPGELKLGNVTLPSWVGGHHPVFIALQFGAAIARAEQQVKHGQRQGAVVGTGQAIGGLLEEVPMMREPAEVAHLARFEERDWSNLARSFAIPQVFQWIAQQLDLKQGQIPPLGDPVHRVPHGLGQNLQMGVPGMRQNVPVSRR
jgi:hypothetical protein